MVMDHAIVGVSSSPDLDQYTEAKIRAQAEFKAIKKSATHPAEGFRYATLKDVSDALLPALLKHGFPMPSYCTGYGPQGWVMVGKLTHKSGQWESSTVPLMLGYEGSNPGVQAFAAACTEAKKILFQGLAGGWQEGDEPEAAAPEVEEEEPENDLVKRAEAKLAEKQDNAKEVGKILGHLDILVEQGQVPAKSAKRLREQYQPKEVASV